MSVTKVNDVEQFEQVIQQHNGEMLFLKNSTICPVSETAFEEFTAFAEDHEHVPTYYLNVQESRPLSNYIEKTFQVKHESPQALLFKNEKVIWNASHFDVTYTSLTEAWNDNK